MPRSTPDARWFHALATAEIENAHSWLRPLASSIETILDVGCWTNSEVFSLLWQLDAGKIVAVDIKPEHMEPAKEVFATLNACDHPSIDGRTIEFMEADITQHLAKLENASFDLAYCDRVLYQIAIDDPSLTKVQEAIKEMHRLVKPGRYIVVVDPNIGAEFETRYSEIMRRETSVRVSLPKDISYIFTALGLIATPLTGAPQHTYIYQKPTL